MTTSPQRQINILNFLLYPTKVWAQDDEDINAKNIWCKTKATQRKNAHRTPHSLDVS